MKEKKLNKKPLNFDKIKTDFQILGYFCFLFQYNLFHQVKNLLLLLRLTKHCKNIYSRKKNKWNEK